MADTGKVKNIEGDLIDSWSGGRLVLKDGVLEVPLEQVYAYTQQTERWVPFDNAAKKAHKDGTEAAEARAAAETPPADEPPPNEQPAESGANDSQEG